MVKDEGEVSGSCEVVSSVRALHRLSVNGGWPPRTAIRLIRCGTFLTHKFGSSCRVSTNTYGSALVSDSLQLPYWIGAKRHTNLLIIAQRPQPLGFDMKLRLSTLLLTPAKCH